MVVAIVTSSVALEAMASSWLKREGVRSLRRAVRESVMPVSPAYRLRREDMSEEVS